MKAEKIQVKLRERRRKFFSQQEFADLLGVNPSHLSRVEHGRASFSAGTNKLALALIALKEKDMKRVERILLKVDAALGKDGR